MASETKVMDPNASYHRWKFFRAGGFDQVLLETGADLTSLEALDQRSGGRTLCARFAPYEAWLEAKPATAVESLGEERVRTILAGDGRTALLDLVARDKAVEPEVTAIASVERLLRTAATCTSW